MHNSELTCTERIEGTADSYFLSGYAMRTWYIVSSESMNAFLMVVMSRNDSGEFLCKPSAT